MKRHGSCFCPATRPAYLVSKRALMARLEILGYGVSRATRDRLPGRERAVCPDECELPRSLGPGSDGLRVREIRIRRDEGQAKSQNREAPMGLSDCRVEALVAASDLARAKRFYERQ